jgi:hypothetical protein
MKPLKVQCLPDGDIIEMGIILPTDVVRLLRREMLLVAEVNYLHIEFPTYRLMLIRKIELFDSEEEKEEYLRGLSLASFSKKELYEFTLNTGKEED